MLFEANFGGKVISFLTRDKSCARVYPSCARIYARIVIKFETLSDKIVIDYHMKFHEDPCFSCGDIGKIKLTFCNH